MSDLIKRLGESARELACRPETRLASYRLEEAAEVIQFQGRTMRDAASLIKAQDKLLAAYRTGSRPSEKTLDALGKRDDVLARLAGEVSA